MRARGLSENTVSLRVISIKVFFRWAHERRLIEENPLAYFRPPRKQINHRAAIPREVISDLLMRLPKMKRRHRLILAIGLYAGLRASEIRCLKVSDIDLEHRMLRVRNGKGRKDRTVQIVDELAAILALDMEGDGWVLPNRVGTDKPVCRHTVYRVVNEALGGACPHQMRTTYATMLLEGGVSIDLVAKEMGHASIDTTAGYRGRSDEGARGQINRALSLAAAS